MKPIKIQVVKVGASLMIPIPKSIAEMMGWERDDILEIPFHEIKTAPKTEESIVTSPEPTGKEMVIVKIGHHEQKPVYQKDVIDILENPIADLLNYRTAYLIWKGKRYGIKNVCKKLFGFTDFNTIEGEKYLKELGFPTFRE
ncbi:MAG: AbrB/MazE/SpoVT family DNA-binding domain-containing protein [Candidatus Methanoperedens sp.]|nr:AbrB/MazE/SpoVT family DNA-binding domain-containing protein [Candidatus Methanoperedens sp.]